MLLILRKSDYTYLPSAQHSAMAVRHEHFRPQMLNGFNSRCLSFITGEQRKETVRRRLHFAGHILRMDENRLLRRTFIAHVNILKCRDQSTLYGCEEMSLTEIIDLAQDRSASA